MNRRWWVCGEVRHELGGRKKRAPRKDIPRTREGALKSAGGGEFNRETHGNRLEKQKTETQGKNCKDEYNINYI